MDEGALVRWSPIEDIWTRLAQTFSAEVERDGDQVRLMFDLMSALPDLPDPGLLLAALDPQSYVWHQGAIQVSFISHLEIEDDDLVFWLTPQPLIDRWPGGADLSWQIQCLLTSFQKARPWEWVAWRMTYPLPSFPSERIPDQRPGFARQHSRQRRRQGRLCQPACLDMPKTIHHKETP